MIISNLAVLLAERKLKISKVSKDTGISRTTLTSLTLNKWLGIQKETLNTLCLYLHVSPSDILAFLPYDINLTEIHIIPPSKRAKNPNAEEHSCDFILQIMTPEEKFSVKMKGKIVLSDFNAEESHLFSLASCVISCKEDENNNKYNSFLESLPIPFRDEFYSIIENKLKAYIPYKEQVNCVHIER